MDSEEMKTLEEKTRKIVDTLQAIEGEFSNQQKHSDDLGREREQLGTLTKLLSDAVKSLNDVTALLKRSTLKEEIEEIDKLTASLIKANELLDSKVDALINMNRQLSVKIASMEADRAKYAELHNQQIEKLDEMEKMISRIDRNTQKGFGKERG